MILSVEAQLPEGKILREEIEIRESDLRSSVIGSRTYLRAGLYDLSDKLVEEIRRQIDLGEIPRHLQARSDYSER